MLPDRAWIAAHIPHAGSMCLLERVESWNGEQILCIATSHRSADNPLRAHGRLGAACALEYAAQAVAVHAALLRTTHSKGPGADFGLLTSARAVELAVGRLDQISGPLRITARRLHAEERSALYDFELEAGARLASGRLSLLLAGGAAR